VERRHAAAEAPGEHVQHLRGERHLRHQDERLSTRLAGGARGAKVDLGLAARGDAVEQERLEARRFNRRDQGRGGIALGRSEHQPVGDGHAQHSILVGVPAGERAREALLPARECRRDHLARRREVVLGDPPGERQDVRGEERRAEHFGDVAHVLERRARDALDERATRRAPAERHLDRRAGQRRAVDGIGDAIREQLPDGHRQRDQGIGHGMGRPGAGTRGPVTMRGDTRSVN